jgi:hypothetical protein
MHSVRGFSTFVAKFLPFLLFERRTNLILVIRHRKKKKPFLLPTVREEDMSIATCSKEGLALV